MKFLSEKLAGLDLSRFQPTVLCFFLQKFKWNQGQFIVWCRNSGESNNTKVVIKVPKSQNSSKGTKFVSVIQVLNYNLQVIKRVEIGKTCLFCISKLTRRFCSENANWLNFFQVILKIIFVRTCRFVFSLRFL